MTMHDDNGHHTAPMALVRPRRNRAKTVAGVAGLAVALGAGAYAITAAVVSDDSGGTREVTAIGQAASAPSAAPGTVISPPAETTVDATGGAAEAANPPEVDPTRSKSAQEEIKEVREKAAKDGVPLMRARTPGPNVATAVGEVTETREGPLKDGATLRIVSARYDLTGQRELLWIADDGTKVGDARCTQNFQFSNNTAPKERPTMMVCWRTSAGKSVVLVAVTPKGRPDAGDTVTRLDEQWTSMG